MLCVSYAVNPSRRRVRHFLALLECVTHVAVDAIAWIDTPEPTQNAVRLPYPRTSSNRRSIPRAKLTSFSVTPPESCVLNVHCTFV